MKVESNLDLTWASSRYNRNVTICCCLLFKLAWVFTELIPHMAFVSSWCAVPAPVVDGCQRRDSWNAWWVLQIHWHFIWQAPVHAALQDRCTIDPASTTVLPWGQARYAETCYWLLLHSQTIQTSVVTTALHASSVLSAGTRTYLTDALLISLAPTMHNQRSSFHACPELGSDKVCGKKIPPPVYISACSIIWKPHIM